MKSTFISRDGSPLNIDPFNLGDGEAWNKTIVAPSGTGMSLHFSDCPDMGPTFDRNPFNNSTQKMVDDYLANCTTHILLRSN